MRWVEFKALTHPSHTTLQLATKAFENAQCLQDDDAWMRYPGRTCLISLRLIEYVHLISSLFVRLIVLG
jgi:hypothetical protein